MGADTGTRNLPLKGEPPDRYKRRSGRRPESTVKRYGWEHIVCGFHHRRTVAVEPLVQRYAKDSVIFRLPIEFCVRCDYVPGFIDYADTNRQPIEVVNDH